MTKNPNVLNQIDSASGKQDGGSCLRPSPRTLRRSSTSMCHEIDDTPWKQDRAFFLEATAQNSAGYKNVDVSLKKGKEFCLQAPAKNSNVLNQIDSGSGKQDGGSSLRPSPRTLRRSSTLMCHEIADKTLKQDRAFLLEATAQNSTVFKNVDMSPKKGKEFCLQTTAKNSNVLNHIDSASGKQDGSSCLRPSPRTLRRATTSMCL